MDIAAIKARLSVFETSYHLVLVPVGQLIVKTIILTISAELGPDFLQVFEMSTKDTQ